MYIKEYIWLSAFEYKIIYHVRGAWNISTFSFISVLLFFNQDNLNFSVLRLMVSVYMCVKKDNREIYVPMSMY